MLSTLLQKQAALAAGYAADEQGFISQVRQLTSLSYSVSVKVQKTSAAYCTPQDWRPFNSRQWLGNYLSDHAALQPVVTSTSAETESEKQ